MSSTPDPADPPPEPADKPVRRIPSGPPPLTKPARGATTMRDMLVAIGVLVVVVLVVGGLSRGFSFAPTGPTIDSTAVPTVDAPAALRAQSFTAPFPLRVPAMPAGWRANSVAQDPVTGTAGKTVRVGYLTDQGRYLQLLQSDAGEEALLASQAGTRTLVAQGTQDVAGQRWVVYGSRPGEPVWIADLGPVRLLVSGSADDDGYRALAAAVLTGEVLKR